MIAGSLEPENVNEVVVYNQNLGGPNEFNINPGVNGNTADTSDPYDGTYAIKVTNWQSLEKITATPDAPISIDIVKQLAFRVKNISGGLFVVRIEGKKSNGQQDSFSIYPSSFGYDYQNTANYQYISMSMPNNNLATLTAIHIVCGANGLSMLFDKVRIISGDAVVINPEYATVQALEQAKQEAIQEAEAYSTQQLNAAIAAERHFVRPPITKNPNFILTQAADVDGKYMHKNDIYCTNSAAIVVTLPEDATEAIEIGFKTNIYWIGSGAVSFTAEAGATLNKDAAELAEIVSQYNGVTLMKIAANTWIILGGLKLA